MVSLDYYGGRDVSLDRLDIRDQECLSLDLRAETGDPSQPADESCVVPPGTFTLSVCSPHPGNPPIGEIRMWYPPARREIRLVGHITGRHGLMELTPDHLLAMSKDADYRSGILKWLGVTT